MLGLLWTENCDSVIYVVSPVAAGLQVDFWEFLFLQHFVHYIALFLTPVIG